MCSIADLPYVTLQDLIPAGSIATATMTASSTSHDVITPSLVFGQSVTPESLAQAKANADAASKVYETMMATRNQLNQMSLEHAKQLVAKLEAQQNITSVPTTVDLTTAFVRLVYCSWFAILHSHTLYCHHPKLLLQNLEDMTHTTVSTATEFDTVCNYI